MTMPVVVVSDIGASMYRACTFCGAVANVETPHKVHRIGRYPNGELIERPVCVACRPRLFEIEAQFENELRVTANELNVMRNLCELAALAETSPSSDALPPSFNEDFADAVQEYIVMLGRRVERGLGL